VRGRSSHVQISAIFDLIPKFHDSDILKPYQNFTIFQALDKKAHEFPADLDPYIHRGDWSLLPYKISSNDRTEAFSRTLVAGRIGHEPAHDEDNLGAKKFHVWSGRTEAEEGSILFIEPFVTAVLKASNNRRFCITSKGYMVLAPAEAQNGDMVCILLGGQTPFILSSEDAQFRLVGPCYVEGIMWGEAMKGLDEGKYEMRDLVIQ
jgi:hypothetical protein